MCIVSNIGDQYRQNFAPFLQPHQSPTLGGNSSEMTFVWPNGPSKEEFDALKKEVMEMKELLIKAKEEDKAAGNPDCEMEEKMKVLKLVADAVGIDISSILEKNGK